MTWLSSSKNSPCPVCARTKDADCGWTADLQTVLCHTRANTSSAIAQPADQSGGYTFTGKIETKGFCDRAIYCLKDDWVKPVRQVSSKPTYYDYPSSVGSPLARVVRLDGAKGKKIWQEHWDGTGWQKGLPDELKAQIHLYRINDPINQEAIVRGLPLRIVEGEKTADALIGIGQAATTSIGGAGKWRHYGGAHGNYSADLKDAVLVLCPDRDRAGVEHCLDIASDYYCCEWLYAAPDSPSWRCYQIGSGYDLADWIDDLRAAGLDADDVFNTISLATEKKARDFDIQPPDSKVKAIATAATDAPNAPKGVKPSLVSFNEEKGRSFPKPQSCVASILAEENCDRLLFGEEAQSFFAYDDSTGIWSAEPDRSVRAMVRSELDARGSSGYGDAYVSGIVRLLCDDLYHKRLAPKSGLLPMRNGVLDLKTLELLPHQPAYHLTSALPYDYNPLATCEPIQQWLLNCQDGDAARVELLRATFKAIVTGRVDLQKFSEFLGGGGTGKSTCANLAIALVGAENTVTTSLKELEQNRFETSNLKGKRLIYIADSERYSGSVSVLKALTGGDPMRNEQKFKQATDPFFCEGWVLLVANEPIAATDYTGGLSRRRGTIPFTRKVAAKDRRDLLTVGVSGISGEFAEYLPGLLNWVLSMPDSDMKRLIMQTSESVPSLSKWKNEILLETNPLAEWINECCVLTPDLRTHIGLADEQRVTEGEQGNSTSRKYYKNEDLWLYPNYRAYCDRVGRAGISVQRFARLAVDLLVNQLDLQVTKNRDRDGSYLKGISLRGESDAPCIISGCDGSEAACDGSVTYSVTTQTLTGVDSQRCDGYSQLLSEISKDDITPAEHDDISNLADTSCKKPSQSQESTPVRLSVVTLYVTEPSHDFQEPSQAILKVGDRVLVTMPKGQLQGVVQVVEGDRVQVDGESFCRWFGMSELMIDGVRV